MWRSRARPWTRTPRARRFSTSSQGARVSARVYDDELPPLRLGPGGRISEWGAVASAPRTRRRTRAGPSGRDDRERGRRTAYVGVRGRSHQAAAIAADRVRVAWTPWTLGTRLTLERADRSRPARRIRSWWREVPPGPGLTLFPLEQEPVRDRLRAPPADDAELLPTGAKFGAETRHGLLTSSTTRRDGMVAVTDYAPTILEWLGLDVPDDMQGRPMRGDGRIGRRSASRWPIGCRTSRTAAGRRCARPSGSWLAGARAAGAGADARGSGCASACSSRCGCRDWRW